MIRQMLGMATLVATLAACGTDPAERTGGGAAAGAATGAVVGAVGGPVGVLAGAAIGAGAGAVTGATTSPRQVNLGRPPWDNPEVRTPMDRNRRTAQTSPRRTPRATPEADRAYQGGGMVGYPDATNHTTGTNAPMPGGTGMPGERMMERPPMTGRGDPMVNPTGPSGNGRTGP